MAQQLEILLELPEAQKLTYKQEFFKNKSRIDKKAKVDYANHFQELFVGMDELLSSLAEEEVHAHLSLFSEPSKSTSVHGYVSDKNINYLQYNEDM